MAEGNRTIPGCSTVHFDPIARQRIYEAIDTANFQDAALIKESYRELKYRLGRIPSMEDFEKHGSIDMMRIIDKFGSCHAFLEKHEKEYKIRFTPMEKGAMTFVSRKFASGKRVHELVMMQLLLDGSDSILQDFTRIMAVQYGVTVRTGTIQSLDNLFTNSFLI